MMTNRDIRREARTMIKGKWFWRIALVAFVLHGIGSCVMSLLQYIHRNLEITPLAVYCEKKLMAMRQGLDFTLQTPVDEWRMLGASTLETFLAYVFGAILLYGLSRVLLKALGREDDRWLADSFGGFSRPLSVSWLLFVMNVRILLWSLLLLIPGLVAVYRYRQAWYLKCENPDWSAGRCLAESSRLMKGRKLKALALDLSYVGWLLPLVALAGAVVAIVSRLSGDSRLGDLCVLLLFTVVVSLFIYLCFYLLAGRTVFYREVKKACAEETDCPAAS